MYKLFFCPDINLVTAAKTCFFDCFASLFVAAVSAKAEGFFACAWHYVLPIDWNRAVYAFACFLYRLEVDADFRDSVFYASGCRSDDKNLVSYLEGI